MVIARICKRDDIDRKEAQLNRSINSSPNEISSRALINATFGLRNALNVMEPPAL